MNEICHEKEGSGVVSSFPLSPSVMTEARTAQQDWGKLAVAKRLAVIRNFRSLVVTQLSEVTKTVLGSSSRPAAELLTAEILPLLDACEFLEREAEKLLRPKRLGKRGLPKWLGGIRSEIHRDALGVVLIIGPGNYPLFLPGVQVVQALVAGNAVLLKPGVGGTTAATTLASLLAQAGLRRNLLTILPESISAAQDAIEQLPDKVIFTGSAATGALVLSQLAGRLIPATMELSGCDAAIIRADADLDLASRAVAFGLTLNQGATCMAPRRAFVAAEIAEHFIQLLSERLRQTQSRKTETLSRQVAQKLRPLLDDALARGARLVFGRDRNDGLIASPIILADVPLSARLHRAELFAPVLMIETVSNDFDALNRTNDSFYALTASIFSRNEQDAQWLARQLNAGVVTINDMIIPTADPRIPFGGRKRSGFGVTRGGEGLLELTTMKVVTMTGGNFRPAFAPAQPGDEQIFQAYITAAHGEGWINRGQAFVELLKKLSGRPKERSEHEKFKK
ncbi:MAG: aldehyde dehydrogenase family protein [Verrucomicrobiota bacterium]|nr:aldehyde dehydrogenase family protein [Verrucomicrobiota bacterium]